MEQEYMDYHQLVPATRTVATHQNMPSCVPLRTTSLHDWPQELNTDLIYHQYMHIPMKEIPEDIIQCHELCNNEHNGYIYTRIENVWVKGSRQ